MNGLDLKCCFAQALGMVRPFVAILLDGLDSRPWLLISDTPRNAVPTYTNENNIPYVVQRSIKNQSRVGVILSTSRILSSLAHCALTFVLTLWRLSVSIVTSRMKAAYTGAIWSIDHYFFSYLEFPNILYPKKMVKVLKL